MRPILSPLIILLTLISCRSFAQKPGTAVEPSWIAKTATDYNLTGSKLLNDTKDGYLNLVHEKQVDLGSRTTYRRSVIRIVTEAGIQNASKVSVEYDPSYQRLVFHNIRIIREGKPINKLELSKIRTIRQETELDRSIYNGSVTAVLFLEDVRKGDVIEYAYSLLGFNPVFRDKYSATLQVQYEAPVGQILYRIVCPSQRSLTVKPRLTAADPVVTAQGNNKVYQWEFTHVAALHAQDDLPSWYDPFPSIQVSEFTSWNDICKWALPLFTCGHPLSPGLKRRIEAIKATAGDNQEKRVLAALRFVQDEVRYMGIEMGINSHKPNDPDKIFGQRFGDCKDKSFLLCTMLRAMDIDASPVLINTDEKQELHQTLPSPVAFDHCTVRVRLAGKSWWFDPTIAFQRGDLTAIAYPDYKCGLVLTDTTTGLTDIPLQDPGQVIATENFTLSEVYGPAKLEVITTYTGSFADGMRDEMNNNSLSDLQQNYLNFYSNYYEGTKVADSLRIEDDEAGGKITTYESYTIDKIWEQERGQKKASFHALLINSILSKPRERDRKMPVALTYPARYTEQIRIQVPEDWNFDHTPTEVRTPSFLYTATTVGSDRTVKLTYVYQALKDHVPAEEANVYFSNFDKMKDDLGYVLSDNSQLTSPGDNSRSIGLGSNLAKSLLCLSLLAGIVFYIRRR